MSTGAGMKDFGRHPAPCDSAGKAPATSQDGTSGADSSTVVFSRPGRPQPRGSWASRAAKIHSCAGPGSGQHLSLQAAALPTPREKTPYRNVGKAYGNRIPACGQLMGTTFFLALQSPSRTVIISFRARQCLMQHCSQRVFFFSQHI